MPLPVVGFFAWFLGLAGSVFGTFTTWMIGRMVYEKAVRYALITAFLVAAAALTLTISLSIKAAIFAAQVFIPSPYNTFTYFLPHNVNQVFALIVTVRVSLMLYRWTVATMGAYVPTQHFGSKWAM